MARCPNCSAKLGCSCKLRKATDGKQCCVSCVTQRNKVLKQSAPKSTSTNTTPVLISATAVQKE
jgi:hypothetical protein